MATIQHSYRVGVSGRGRGEDQPVIHASTGRRRTPSGGTDEALCGAGVWPRSLWHGRVPDDDEARRRVPMVFDPSHPRACRRCVAALNQ